MDKIINKIPIPIAGLMLSLGAAGNLLASYGSTYKYIFGALSAIIFLVLSIKLFTCTKAIVKNLDNPVAASVAPTFSMGVMILSTYIKSIHSSTAYVLWIMGILLHILLMILVTKKFIFKFNIKNIFPSYFVVYVGIVVGSVTAPAFNSINIGQILFWFGFVAYLLLLPIVLYRVFKIKAIPEPALPTTAIFAAPASLCLAGYMSSFQEKNILMVWLLTSLSLFMLLGVLIYMPKMLKLKFYPSYAAFTFPCVISAIAIKKTNAFLISIDQGIPILKYIVKFEELLAVVISLYVLIRYIEFIFIEKPVQTKDVIA